MPEESEIDVARAVPVKPPNAAEPAPGIGTPQVAPPQVAPQTGGGVEPAGRSGRRREWPATLAVTAVASVIAWIRMPTAVAGWLYAEDGRSFIGDWLGSNQPIRGDLALLWMPYAGYQHLIPRLAAGAVTLLLPPAWWALAVNAIACLVVGSIAGLVYLFSRDVIGFRPARVVLGLLTVMTPVVGLEALGNLANLHWFLLYLIPWLLLATPRSTAGAWAMAVVALLATATEPQCAIFLPLAVWRFVQVPGTRPVVVGALIGVGAQVITTLEAPRALGTDNPPVASTIEGYVLNAGMTLATTHIPLLGEVIVRIGWWIGFLGVAAIFAVAAVGVVKGRPMARVAILALLYGSVVSWTASFVLGRNPAFFYSEMDVIQLGSPLLVRWGTAASILLAATVPVTVAVMVERYPRWRPAWIALLGVLGLALIVNLIVHPARDSASWEQEVDGAVTSCASTPDGDAQLATPPDPGWVVEVPCAEILR